MSPTTQSSFLARHRKALLAVGVVLASAVGAGVKAFSEARAERKPVVIEVPAADVVGLREDIGYLRDDIREERHSRETLATQVGELNSRLSRLEGAAAAKAKARGK